MSNYNYNPTCFRLESGVIGFTIEVGTASTEAVASTMFSPTGSVVVYDYITTTILPDSPLYSAVAALYLACHGDIRGRNNPPENLPGWDDSEHSWDWDTCSQPWYDLEAATPRLSEYQAARNLSDLLDSL